VAYTDVSTLGDYLRNTIVADEVEIEAAALGAKSIIDWFCHRSFDAAGTAASTRNFRPHSDLELLAEGSTIFYVPDIAGTASLTVVENGGTLTASEWALDEDEAPYTRLRRIDAAWGTQVAITATWGWPDATPPAAVMLSSKLLVRDILLSRDMAYGLVQVGEYSRRVAENSVVEMLLAPLRRPEALGVA
jgi:hypothetical protein